MIMNLQEILNTCDDWGDFCGEKGFCAWSVNEGGGNVQVDLTVEEAAKFGIVEIKGE